MWMSRIVSWAQVPACPASCAAPKLRAGSRNVPSDVVFSSRLLRGRHVVAIRCAVITTPRMRQPPYVSESAFTVGARSNCGLMTLRKPAAPLQVPAVQGPPGVLADWCAITRAARTPRAPGLPARPARHPASPRPGRPGVVRLDAERSEAPQSSAFSASSAESSGNPPRHANAARKSTRRIPLGESGSATGRLRTRFGAGFPARASACAVAVDPVVVTAGRHARCLRQRLTRLGVASEHLQ